MYENGYTIHVGVDGPKENREVLQWSMTSAMRFAKDHMTTLVAAVDGDSFFEWGEKITDIQPMHVTMSFTLPFSGRTLLNVWSGLEQLSVQTETILLDYVVITDREEWSKDARIIIAEDIYHLANNVANGGKDFKIMSYQQASWLE